MIVDGASDVKFSLIVVKGIIISSSLGLKVNEAYYGDTLFDCEFQVQLAVEQNFIRGSPALKTV